MPPVPSLPRQLACRERGLLVAMVAICWLGTWPFLGSLLPDVVQILRSTGWAHLSLLESLHSFFSLLWEWTYKTQCGLALPPTPYPPVLLRGARWFPAPNLSSYWEATCDLRQLSKSPRETECLVLPSQGADRPWPSGSLSTTLGVHSGFWPSVHRSMLGHQPPSVASTSLPPQLRRGCKQTLYFSVSPLET